uniref:RING-H2 finger protein ATL3A n=1 Tax=Aegilops tauschii TaxID=37682 RepID=M8BLU2_AEGTA
MAPLRLCLCVFPLRCVCPTLCRDSAVGMEVLRRVPAFSDRMMIPHHDWVTQFDSLEQPFWQGNIRSARTLSRLILFPVPTFVKYWTSGYEVVRGNQIERRASSGSITEPTRNVLFSTRHSATASNDRLPDAVQQAKERLHQRLRSVDLFSGRSSQLLQANITSRRNHLGQQAKERLHQRLRSVDLFSGRRQTSPAVGTIWAGPDLPSECDICSSEDGWLAHRTIRFNSSASLSAYKDKQITAETFSNAAVVAPHDLRPVSKLGQEALQGTIDGDDDVESSVDCSICLEGCHGASDGLIQLRCKHIFHLACLEQWLQSRADCPYCRAGVVLS